MKKLVYLNARITVLLDEKIKVHCDELKLTKSDLVYKALIYYLDSKGFKDIEKSLQLEKKRSELREMNHDLYLIKNTFMTIIRIAKMSLLISGKVDYEKIDMIIKKSVSIYNSFSPKIKKVMKEEIRCIEKLRFNSYLMQYMNNWDIVTEFIIQSPKTKRIEIK